MPLSQKDAKTFRDHRSGIINTRLRTLKAAKSLASANSSFHSDLAQVSDDYDALGAHLDHIDGSRGPIADTVTFATAILEQNPGLDPHYSVHLDTKYFTHGEFDTLEDALAAAEEEDERFGLFLNDTLCGLYTELTAYMIFLRDAEAHVGQLRDALGRTITIARTDGYAVMPDFSPDDADDDDDSDMGGNDE